MITSEVLNDSPQNALLFEASLMLVLKLAIRNLMRHPLKSGLLGILIAFGTSLLFCANAVFESTTRGLEISLIGSLTGDFAIGAESLGEESYGLFGSEVPIVNEYETIPPIADFASVSAMLNSTPHILHWTPLVSAAAEVNIDGFIVKAPVFGVDEKSYFTTCSDIQIVRGNPNLLKSGGVFINSELAKKAEKALGRTLNLGEPIVFSMYSNGSFRVRRGHFAGVHRYPAPIEILSRVILTDPVIVRSLSNYTMGYAATSNNNSEITETPTDLDDLFSDASDTRDDAGSALELSEVESVLADTKRRNSLILTDAAAWSYIIVRIEKSADPSAIRHEVEHTALIKKTVIRVLDWKTAAGTSALILFAVRSAFNVGIGFLIFGASLIIMNALVIAVLERTNEIASMRALGASKGFIRSLFILETMILTVMAATGGVLLGIIMVYILAFHGVVISNPLLISLFGGRIVRPIVEFRGIFVHLLGAAIIGSLAWTYPVFIALRIKPVSGMAE